MIFFMVVFIALGVAVVPVVTVSQSDIMIYVYNHSNREKYAYSFNLSDTSEVGDYIDCSKLPVLLVFHGWGTRDNYTNYTIVQTAARHCDITILGVDYPFYSNYITAVEAILPIGQYVGGFIDTLVNKICKGITYDDIRIVGHSLGAHKASVAAKTAGQRIPSIVGLDPAGPMIVSGADNALTPDAAKNVQVIHTNGGLLGTNDRNGKSNFYPNGGIHQPGCNPLSICSHMHSVTLYAESLSSPGSLRARACSSYNVITTTSLCATQATAVMGGLIPEQLCGDYYLTTD